MIVANRAFPLTEGVTLARGEEIAPAVWSGLRERTRRVLVSMRYVREEQQTTEPPRRKRGRPRKKVA